MAERATRIAIVGAGLSGALLANLLGEAGYEIEVFEHRPDPRTKGFIGGRSINLALSARGIHGLKRAGLAEKVLADAIPMAGRMIHSPAGQVTFQPYSKDPRDAINSVSRDEDSGHAFKPYSIREVGGHRIAIIGQAFPYTPIANPSRFIPDWTFGIRDDDMQELVDSVRASEKPDAVVVLSHNGMDVDVKMASRVSGIDAILGGHTHDGVPQPIIVANSGGKTLVTNAGSNGKFLAVLDLDIGAGKVNGYRYRLLPVFANLLPADAGMSAYIDEIRKPYLSTLEEPLAVAESLLYRRGNFNGTFDQVICDALLEVGDAEISLSPGFRWGTSVLPGDTITMERLMDQTAMTYPETYSREMSGAEIKTILESVADNLFHIDPYYQQGGDMVRVGGLNFRCDPMATMDSRIDDLTLDDGRTLEAGKQYKVAGWATVGSESPGPPVWDVVAEHLRARKTITVDKMNTPKLRNVSGNAGLADYAGVLE